MVFRSEACLAISSTEQHFSEELKTWDEAKEEALGAVLRLHARRSK
jgi:hypothetical protein